MGKRVSNKRGEHVGARSGRIRIGWRKIRALRKLHGQMDKLTLQTATAEVRAKAKRLLKTMRKIMPKRPERRTQTRGQ